MISFQSMNIVEVKENNNNDFDHKKKNIYSHMKTLQYIFMLHFSSYFLHPLAIDSNLLSTTFT